MSKFFSVIAIVIATLTLFAFPAAAGNGDWQGVFTQADQSGGIWTASVFDRKRGEHLTKEFHECREVIKPIRGWACRDEVLDFVFEGGGNYSNDSGGHNYDVAPSQNGTCITTSSRGKAHAPQSNHNWSGYFTQACQDGDSWNASVTIDGQGEKVSRYAHCELNQRQVWCY